MEKEKEIWAEEQQGTYSPPLYEPFLLINMSSEVIEGKVVKLVEETYIPADTEEEALEWLKKNTTIFEENCKNQYDYGEVMLVKVTGHIDWK